MRDLQFEYFDLEIFQRRWKIGSVYGEIESKSICGRQKFENIFLLFLIKNFRIRVTTYLRERDI